MASSNRDIKMRIFLEAGNAERAYNSFVKRVEENQARMAELKKQGLSGSAEYKQLREETKVTQQLIKLTQQSYEDLGTAVQNINSKALFEIEGLIKDVNKRIRTMIPGRDDKELSGLTEKLGILQRELAARNKQIKDGALRTYQEVLRDIHTSQQNLNEISKQGQALAIARNNEEVALKKLSTAQHKYEEDIRKFNNYEIKAASSKKEVEKAKIGINEEVLTAINKQIAAQEVLYKLEHAPKSQRLKVNYERDLQAAKDSVEVEKAKVESVTAAHNADAVAVKNLIKLETEYMALVQKPVKRPDEGKFKAKESDLQKTVNENKRLREEAEKVFNDIQAKAGNDKPFQHSIETLRRLQAELKAVRDAEMNVAERNEINLHLQTIDRTIKDMETHLMTNAQVQDVYKKAIDELTKGTGANSAKLRENIELMKTAMQSKEIDAQMNSRLASAIQASTKLLETEGHSYMNMKQASKAYLESKLLIAQGDKANVDQLRQYIFLMEQATNMEGLQVRQKQAFNAVLKEMKDTLSSTTQSFLSLEQAQQIYDNKSNNTVGQLRDAIDLYKHLANARETDAAEAQMYNSRAKELNDILTKQTTIVMEDAQAQDMIKKATEALKDPMNMEASALRDILDGMRKIQQAKGPMVKTNQQAAQTEKQLVDVLRGREKATMDAAMAESKYKEALTLIEQGENANASAVKAMIEAMKEARVAEGVNIKTANEYYLVEKQLTDMLQAKTKVVMSATEAETAYQNAKALLAQGDYADAAAMKESVEQMEKARVARGINVKTSREYILVLDKLKAALNGTSKASLKVAYDANFVNSTINNIKKAPIDDLKKALEMVEGEMKSLDRSTQMYIDSSKRYKKIKDELDRINGAFKTQKKVINDANKSIKDQGDWLAKATTKLLNYVGIFGGFYLVRNQVQKMFEANIKYDDSLSNIRKTTQLTSEAVGQLAENIKKINTRTTLEDITNLAYAAGRLGVKGTADIMGFVRAADQINIALGEQLNGQESVEQLMKITNLMGANKEFGIEQALLKTGSAINELTMNSTATAQPMVDFMKRTAGIATQSGMTTAELTGLAGAVNALGQNVEMSATSISKMMVQISSNSKKVAKALQLDAEETQKFFYDIQTGRMMDALMTVLQKTREAGGLSHLGTIVKDLGSEGQRVIQTIATLSSNYQQVRSMVEMSTKAFEEGTSATNEYNIKNQNTAALWEKIKNSFSKMFVSTHYVEFFNRLLVKLQDLPVAVNNIIHSFSLLKPVFEGLIFILTKVTWILETFVQVFAIRSFARYVLIWISSLRALDFAVLKQITSWKRFIVVLKNANNALKLNIFTAIITVLISLYHAFTDATNAAKDFDREVSEGLERVRRESQQTGQKIGEYLSKINSLNEKSLERADIIKEINSTYGDYLEYQLEESDGNNKIAESLAAVNAQLRLKALLEGKEEAVKNIRSGFDDQRGAARTSLVDAIMEYMNVPDRATAANIANSLINNEDNILYKEYNRDDQKYEYRIGDIYHKTTGNSKDLYLQAFGNINQKTTKDINGNTIYTGYQYILSKLVDYANVTGEMQGKIERAESVYEADINNAARESKEYYRNASVRQFSDVIDVVTQNGTLSRYATKEDQNIWADARKGLTNEKRNEVIEQLDEYIAMAKQQILSFENTGLEEDLKIAEREKMNLSNAELARKIYALGNLENKPDNGPSGRNPGSDLYGDIIAKIKTFYEHLGDEYKQQLLEGRLTQTEYEKRMDENSIQMHDMLRAARLRIVGKITKDEYEAALDVMKGQVIKDGDFDTKSDFEKVLATGDPEKIGDFLRKMAKTKDEDGEKSSALLSQIRLEAAKDQTAQLEIYKKQNEALLKMLLENNPIGSLDEKWQKRFEEMNLMFMKLGGETPEERQENERIAMGKMQELGAMTRNIDIDTESGLQTYLLAVMDLFPDFEEKWTELQNAIIEANNNGDEALKKSLLIRKHDMLESIRSMYYETYQYDRDIDEAISKQVEKHKKLWEKMYKQSNAYQVAKDEIDNVKEQYKYIQRMQNFGFSNRTALARNIVVKQTEADLQNQIWEVNKAKAEAMVNAAKADVDAGKDGAEARLKQAQAELEKISEMPDAARTANQAVEDAMNALLDATHVWIAETTKAFEKFMDSFIPFRSWYEDKGTEGNPFWRNVVGTTEERKKAFGQFMDDLKKMIREEYMQRTKAKITEWAEKRKREKEEREEQMRQQAVKEAQMADETEFLQTLYNAELEIQTKFQEESLKQLEEYNKKRRKLLGELIPEPTVSDSKYFIGAGGETDPLSPKATPSNVDRVYENAEYDLKTREIEYEISTLIETLNNGLDEVINKIQSGFADWQNSSPELASIDEVDTSSYKSYRASFDDKSHRDSFDEHTVDDSSAIQSVNNDENKQPSEKTVSAQVFGNSTNAIKSGAGDAISGAVSETGDQTGVVSSLATGAVNFATDKAQEAISRKAEKRRAKETKSQKKEQDKQVSQAIASEKKKEKAIEATEMGLTALKKTEGAAQVLVDKSVNAQAVAGSNASSAQIEANDTKKAATGMWGNLGRAVSEAWAQGGPYLGPALAAGVSAAVGALITMVMNMMGHKGDNSASSSVNTKLVSGMLTYDQGNVQSFGVKRYDNGLVPVMADNGRVYMARTEGSLGTGMVMQPTLTTIGGAPALVGEEGPEMVIGRETTRALQMNRPDIMAIIQAYDSRHSRGYAKAYDNGNVSAVASASRDGMDIQQTLALLNNTLATIQQNGIQAKINKYGRGGLIDEVASGIEQTQRVGSSTRVKRVFG